MAMDANATMCAAFVQVAKAKHVQPYYYGQLQAVSRGARVPPDVRLERLHRGIQPPLGLGWKLHHLLHPPLPLIHMVTILMGNTRPRRERAVRDTGLAHPQGVANPHRAEARRCTDSDQSRTQPIDERFLNACQARPAARALR